ncbi:MAG: hypothetical protein IJ637_06485 [Prevotella sp.]|nr:hypothetical protein [Prevotella sp.]
MKKEACVSLFLLACVSAMAADLWDGLSSDKSWYDGSKTELYVYTGAQLKGLADLVNNDSITFEGKTICLMDDIDMGYNEWIPIGNARIWNPRTFMGTFDGGEHKITRLMVRTRETDNFRNLGYGFFGSTKDAEVRNLSIDVDVNLREASPSGYYRVGGLVASGSCNAKHIFANVNIRIDSNVNAQELECGGVFGDVAGDLEDVLLEGGYMQYSQSWFSMLYIGSLAKNCQNIKRCKSSFSINMRDVSQPQIGGLAYWCNSISDAIYTGAISTNTYYQNGGMLKGIAVMADGVLQNCIFAPSSITLNGGVYQYPFAIGGGEKVLNCYYLSGYAYMNDGKGIPITLEQLQSGNALSDFNPSVWEFKAGNYPIITTLKQQFDISVPTANGKISFRVKEGDSATIRIQADREWKVLTVYVDGIDVTTNIQNGSYRFEEVKENHEINVVYEQLSNGIRVSESHDQPLLRVIEGNCVEISNVKTGSIAKLYDLDGRIILSRKVSSGEVMNLKHGTYILKVGNKSFKFSI